MDTSFYINKILEQLAVPASFEELNSDPIQAIKNDGFSTLDYLHNTHQIGGKTRHHLTPPKPARIPFFYGLPKVHKLNIPIQQIVSGFDSPLVNFQTFNTPTSAWERHPSHCWCYITLH